MNTYDAIAIRGGPGGSTAANYLVQAGNSILDREKFPRFHIGESLLPYNEGIFRELGLLEPIKEEQFVVKHGARIGLADGSKLRKIKFKNGCFTEVTTAFQVERSRFDQMLLDRAKEVGVEVKEETEVSSYEFGEDSVSVTDKSEETYEGKYLVDASGTVDFTVNRDGIKTNHPKLSKIAVISHYKDVKELPGDDAGDIQIMRHPKAWFWLTPLGNGICSVGIVFDKNLPKSSGLTPKELFREILRESDAVVARLEGATETRPLQAMADSSYANERLVSEQLIRVGDSAGFLDPIFSSGVYLAMLMGKDGANALIDAIGQDQALSSSMKAYEKTTLRNTQTYRDLIIGFYLTRFFELLVQPEEKRLKLPCALNAIFAGRLDQVWSIRWRILVFRALARLQAMFPIVPRTGLRQD